MWTAQVGSEQSTDIDCLVLQSSRYVLAVRALSMVSCFWFWQCQRLHMLTGQVIVTLGTVTFEFSDLHIKFQLHNLPLLAILGI